LFQSSFPVLQAVDLLAPASMFCTVFQQLTLWKVVRLWRFRAVFDPSRLLTLPSLSDDGRTASLRCWEKASDLWPLGRGWFGCAYSSGS
jgi:hypothetical protein